MVPHRIRGSLVLAAVAMLAMSAATGGALAQVPDKAMAEKFFLEGRDLMKAGRTAEACDRFERSQSLEPRLGTLLNVATCHEELGRSASAWAEFVEAAEQAKSAKDEKRSEFARTHAAELEPKLSRVEISRAPDARDVEVTLDGKPLNAALLGTAIPLDPGKHVVEAHSAGHKRWSQDLVVPVGPARLPVKVPALEAEGSAPPPAVVAPEPRPAVVVAPPRAVEAPEHGGGGWPTVTYIGFGVGAVGVVIGAVTGSISLANTSAIASGCTNGACASTDAGPISRANTLANVSNVSFAIAGAGAVVGVVALLAAGPSKPAQQSQLAPLHATARGLELRF